jgi:hypothetical protein
LKERSFPFLAFDDENDPINMATDTHLLCERRGGSKSTNPYSNPYIAFYITFYKRLTDPNLDLGRLTEESRKRDLRIGRLYNKPRKNSNENGNGEGNGNRDKLAFRQSSFTVSSLSLVI